MTEYISREAVLETLKRECSPKVFAYLADQVNAIPAADVRPVVRARWNTVKYPLYECSNCGAVYQEVGYGFNYCPNCGAMMEES